MNRPIRVLVADPSGVVRRTVSAHLRTDPSVASVDSAADGASARLVLSGGGIDVVLTASVLGDMTAADLTRWALVTSPVPIVVLSTDLNEVRVRDAMAAGAVGSVSKRPADGKTASDVLRAIVAAVRSAAGIAVVRPLTLRRAGASGTSLPTRAIRHRQVPSGTLIVIAASTGGPQVLAQIVSEIRTDLEAGILIIQHMPHGMTGWLAEYLATLTVVPVAEAREGDQLTAGLVWVAPGGVHTACGPDRRVRLRTVGRSGEWCPSADRAMTSAAEQFGPGCVGVVLSGMGADGAEGLAAINAAGGRTIVQHPDSCILPNMPRAALERVRVDAVAHPSELADQIRRAIIPTNSVREASTP